MAEQFAEFIATIRVDDADLRNSLREDAAAADAAATSIQRSMNRVSASATRASASLQKTGTAAKSAGAAMSAFSASMIVASGSIAVVSAEAGVAVAMLSRLGSIVSGMKAFGAAVAASGVAMASLAAGTIVVVAELVALNAAARVFGPEILTPLTNWIEGLGEAEAKVKELNAKLREKQKAAQKAAEAARIAAAKEKEAETEKLRLYARNLRQNEAISAFHRAAAMEKEEAHAREVAALAEIQRQESRILAVQEQRARAARAIADIDEGRAQFAVGAAMRIGALSEADVEIDPSKSKILRLEQRRADLQAREGSIGQIGTVNPQSLAGGAIAGIAIGAQNIVVKNTAKIAEINQQIYEIARQLLQHNTSPVAALARRGLNR